MSGTNTAVIAGIMLEPHGPILAITPTNYSRAGQTARPGVSLTDVSSEQHRQKLAQASNKILRGAIDCNVPITLTPNGNETLVFDARVSTWTAPHIVPVSASAKAESLNAAFYTEIVTTSVPGYSATYIKINHTVSADATRTFILSILG